MTELTHVQQHFIQWRREKGMSQAEVGAMVRLCRESISAWEKPGKTIRRKYWGAIGYFPEEEEKQVSTHEKLMDIINIWTEQPDSMKKTTVMNHLTSLEALLRRGV